MPGILTRKSNFADLESFDDFQPRASAAHINQPDTPEQLTAEPSQSRNILPSDQEPQQNSWAQADSRKEKADLQRLARQSGYTINNLVEKPIPARLEPESNTFLKTIRIEVSDWNRFQRWCHANSYSHKKGFKMLTQKLPVK